MNFTSSNLDACFSGDYPEARAKFLAAASSCEARISNFVHPALGSAGEELATDVATLGDEAADSLLVHVSGTHGVEGFLGSAIQIALMNAGVLQSRAGNVSVAMVHGLNPYGFSYGRRVNESNVDLNRNFIDFSAQRPANDGYAKLHGLLMLPPTTLGRARRSFGLAWCLARMGPRGLQSAVTNGQHDRPDGLFYGGDCESWSRLVWQDIMKSLYRKGRKTFVIDYHTGLGKFAAGEVTCPIAPEGGDSWFANLLKTCFDDEKVRFLGVGKSVATAVRGDLLSFATRHSQGETAAVFHEFGTLPPLQMLDALASENWAHHHCPQGSSGLQEARLKLRDAFCPKDQGWRSEVWRQAEGSVALALKFLADN